MTHQPWTPTRVRSEIFNERETQMLLSKAKKEKASMLMAQTDIELERIIEESKKGIFDDYENKSEKEKMKILKYLFNRL